MVIYRNGIEYELTATELMDAHTEYEMNCMVQDVKNFHEDREYPFLSDGSAKEIAEIAIRNLSKCDSYFDAFWDVVEVSIRDKVCSFAKRDAEILSATGIVKEDNVMFLYKNIDCVETSFTGTVVELYEIELLK